jgi:hypothetical protein
MVLEQRRPLRILGRGPFYVVGGGWSNGLRFGTKILLKVIITRKR